MQLRVELYKTWNVTVCHSSKFVHTVLIRILSKLTNTPATIEAIVFLLSLQSIHSHSGQRKLSRNPAISSNIRLLFLFCTYTFIFPLTVLSSRPETQPKMHLIQSSKTLRCLTTLMSNFYNTWGFFTELSIPFSSMDSILSYI